MDYQPMDQTTGQAMGQDSSNVTRYVIGLVVIVVLGLGYFFWVKAPAADTQTSAVEQTQIPQLTEGNTTADISADLNQIPDSSAALNQDAAASAQDISGF